MGQPQTTVLCPKCRGTMRVVNILGGWRIPDIGLECTKCGYTLPKETDE